MMNAIKASLQETQVIISDVICLNLWPNPDPGDPDPTLEKNQNRMQPKENQPYLIYK